MKNQAKANAYRRLSSPFSIAVQLMYLRRARRLAATSTPTRTRSTRVTAADLQRVAKQYFTKENRTVGIFLRKEGAAAEPRTRSSRRCPRRRRPWRGSSCSRSQPRRTPRKLREGIAQMAAGAGPGAAGDEAGVRADPEAGAGAPGRPGRREEVRTTTPAARRRCSWPPLRAGPAAAQAIPDHPDKLVFQPIAYTPPRPTRPSRGPEERHGRLHRRGPRRCPSSTSSLTLRTGSYLEPAGKEGLAALTGSQIRRGGTQEPHRRAARRAARLPGRAASAPASATPRARASLNCLRDNLDESLKLFVEMLKRAALPGGPPGAGQGAGAPGDEEAQRRLRGHRAARVERAALRRGALHATASPPRPPSRSITRDDLVAFHRQLLPPREHDRGGLGLVLARGDDPQAGGGLRGLAGHEADGAAGARGDRDRRARASTASRRTSTRAACPSACPSVRRDNPDIYALEVMNEILGGSGFTSRITRTVRSNEGLAYSAGSGLALRRLLPGRVPRRLPVQEPHACPTRRSSCWRRSRRSARSR